MGERRKVKKAKKGAVTDRSQAVNGLVKQVRGIHSPRAAMRLLGWSYRVAGIEIGAWCNRKPFAKSTVIRWCHRRGSRWYLPLDADKLNAWGKALNAYVTRIEPALRFQMTVNSPWRCWVEEQDKRGKWRKVDLRKRRGKSC